MKDKIVQRLESIMEKLESGIDAHEYSTMAGIEALTGGEENIVTELDHKQSMILSIMETICYPRRPDGTIDETIAYDEPIISNFVKNYKLNMISFKRKGRMELVKVMRGEEEEESFTSRIKQAIRGDD